METSNENLYSDAGTQKRLKQSRPLTCTKKSLLNLKQLVITARNFVCLFFQQKSVETLPPTFVNFITAPNGRLIFTG